MIGEIFTSVLSTGIPKALLCNGSFYDIDTYQELASLLDFGDGEITTKNETMFSINLTDKFIRGMGGIDRTVLSLQPDDIKDHRHKYIDRYVDSNSTKALAGINWPMDNQDKYDHKETSGVIGGASHETRPVNVALYYWVQAE